MNETAAACDLGLLPMGLHADLTGLIHKGNPQYRNGVRIALKHGGLNNYGELQDDDVVILGGTEEAFNPVLMQVYEHLAASYQIEDTLEDWLEACRDDGQMLACFGVGRHNDDGVALRGDRLLLVLRTPGYYRLDAFNAEGDKDFESVLKLGQMVIFDESLDHQLVMLGAKDRWNSEDFVDPETGLLPESQLAYLLNLPNPLVNQA